MKTFKMTAQLGLVLALGSTAFLTACGTSEKEADKAIATQTPDPVEPNHLHVTLEARSKSKATGSVHFESTAQGTLVKYDVKGLKKNSRHGFHIHEKGDCSAADASTAGGHFNPTGQPHGDVHAAARHVGDLGNIKADKKGVAKGEMTVTGLKLSEIKGLSVIVHGKPDDGKSQPTGDSGDRISCGVLM